MATDNVKQKKRKELAYQNPVEAFKDIGRDLKKTVVSDLAAGTVSDLWEQFLGGEKPGSNRKNAASGDLSEGQELNLSGLSKQNKDESETRFIDPGIDYRREILHGEQKITRETSQIVETKIQEIIVELKKLTASSKELEIQFKDVTIEQMPVNAGKYHLTFFEWVLTTIKQAQMKVEDSANWLSMFTSKKGKKQYWSMFKKHGTTFGLSNERVVATQTG